MHSDNKTPEQIISEPLEVKAEINLEPSPSEQNFKNSTDYSPLPILINTEQGDIIYANQAMIELFGFSTLTELQAVPYQHRYPKKHLARMEERWRKTCQLAVNELNAELVETEIIRPSGDTIPVEVFTRKILWDGEECLETLYNDITERKKAEEDLRNSNELFKAVFNSSKDAISVINTSDYTIARANDVFLRQCGASDEKEVIGHTCHEQTHHLDVPCSTTGVICPLQHTIVSKKHFSTEHYHFTKENGEVIAEITTSPLFDENGVVTQVVHSSKDITDRKQRETQLSFQSEIISNMSEGVFSVRGNDGQIIYANPRFENMLGYDCGELAGRNISEIRHPADNTSGGVSEQINDQVQRIGHWNGEMRHIRKDSSLCWSQVSVSKHLHPEYGFTMVAVVSDITERKQATEELNFRALLLDSASDAILVINLDGITLYVNEAFCTSHGYSREELIGQHLSLFETSGSGIPIDDRIKGTLLKGQMEFETTHHRKDGSQFDVEVHALVLNPGGREMILSIERDITDRIQTEEALRESEQNFRLSMDDSPLAIIINQSMGETVYANQAALDMFGYRDLEQLRQESFVRHHTPENLVLIRERWERIHQGEFISERLEHDIIRVNGEIRHVEAFIKGILWDGEELQQVIYQDITERKQMEEQLRHSQVLASLGEMTAGIAHEVGNPLSSIILYSEVALQNKAVSRQTKEDLRVIHAEAKRAGHLIKDLLTYSRKLKPSVQRVNLNQVIEEVIRLRQYQQTIQNITLITNIASGVVNVKGDRSQLTQVMLNLVLNAEESLKEPGGGTIWVSSSVKANRVKISVMDDGPGIPKENIDQIFMPFFTTKNIGEGTGLGLSTCYGIVTGHNGTISVENNKRGGATFIVQLPLMDQDTQGTMPLDME